MNGIGLFYTVKGEGIPIVFIHPPLITSEVFKYQLEQLSREFKVITFDIRGHGRSQYSHQPVTYSLIVDDIRQLLDHLGVKKSFICGYSTGGSVVLEFLLNSSDRSFGGIIVGGMSEVNDWYLKQSISLAIRLAKAKTLPLLSLAISWGNANTQDTFRKLHQEALKGNARNIEQYYRYSLHYNCTNQLKKIALPILLVYGQKNKTFHRYANLLHEKLPHNELKFIAKEKHQIPTKAAIDLNQMIEKFIQTYNEMNSE